MKLYVRFFRNPSDAVKYLNTHSISMSDVLVFERYWNCSKQLWTVVFQYDLNGGDEETLIPTMEGPC
jgi:hypothetical protein